MKEVIETSAAENFRQIKARGKILVERKDGFWEEKSECDVLSDIQSRRLVAEEVTEWHPDENGIARECPTGYCRYRRSRT
jgi:hypothetical protein